MATRGANSKLFEEVIRELISQGLCARFQAFGTSMVPTICDGEVVEITPIIVNKLREGDIVLTKTDCGFCLHRIVLACPAEDVFVTRGDNCQENDLPMKGAQIVGLARAKEVRVARKVVQARFRGVRGWLLRRAARIQFVACNLFRKVVSLVLTPSQAPS